MLITRYPTTRYQPASKKARPACPVCGGLQCLCRPRFFAGQLLTEDDLNRLDRYIREKHRLHNRHLHGWGVVCGLEVTCHECDNLVEVSAGYALSPCGDDIVVCEEDPVDICELIRKCWKEERSCEPRRRRQPTDCDDAEETWLLAICYDEKPSRGITSLRSTGASCSCSKCSGSSSGCGCGCGGGTGSGGHGGSGCSCGGGSGGGYANGHTNGNGNGMKNGARTAVKAPPVQCEPTVICEGYRYEVYKLPTATDDDSQGDLIERFQCCAQPYLDFVQELAQAFDDLSSGALTDNERYQLCCSMKRRLREILISRPVHDCTLLDRLARIHCAPEANVTITHRIRDMLGSDAAILDSVEGFAAGQTVTVGSGATAESTTIQSVDVTNTSVTFSTSLENDHGPGEPVTAVVSQGSNESLQEIVLIWYQALLACLCSVLLPPCPAPAEDNCVPLATVTVRRSDCQILRVCNWTVHRKFATTFPNLQYWLSILPFMRDLRELIERVCCELPEFGRVRDPAQPAADPTNAAGRPTAQPAGTSFGASTDPFAATQSRDFAKLVTDAALGRGTTFDPETLFRGMMGASRPDNQPYMRAHERAHLPQYVLLNQLAQPFVAAAMPRDLGGGFGRTAAGTRTAAEERSEVEALRGEVDALRTSLEQQKAVIDDLSERLGGNK